MAEHPIILLGLVVIAALVFDFINGFHDTANAIATSNTSCGNPSLPRDSGW